MLKVEDYYNEKLASKKVLEEVVACVAKGDFYFDGDFNAEGDEICVAHMPGCASKTQDCINDFFADVDTAVDALRCELQGVISGSVKGRLHYRTADEGCAKKHLFEETCIEFKPFSPTTPYFKVFTVVDKRITRYGVELRIVPVLDWHY